MASCAWLEHLLPPPPARPLKWQRGVASPGVQLHSSCWTTWRLGAWTLASQPGVSAVLGSATGSWRLDTGPFPTLRSRVSGFKLAPDVYTLDTEGRRRKYKVYKAILTGRTCQSQGAKTQLRHILESQGVGLGAGLGRCHQRQGRC